MSKDPYPSDQQYFEDLQIGDVYRIPSRTVTETHFTLFAGLTGDFHPIHLDEEYASTQTGFDGRVAHGMMTTMFTVLGASNLSPHIRDSARAFVEQSSRFLEPVYVGDTLSMQLRISEMERKRDSGLVTFTSTAYNQHDTKVLEGELKYLIACRTDTTESTTVD